MGSLSTGNDREIEQQSHAFVIKIWCEECGAGQRGAVWRGSITHVGSGERRAVTRLCQLEGFMAPYLHDLHIRQPLLWRICGWLIP